VHRYFQTLIVTAILLNVHFADAGGPFVVDAVNDSGVVQQWQDKTLTWYSEDGDLSNSVNNAMAKQWVTDAINKWVGASLRGAGGVTQQTVDVTVKYAGSVGKNIDVNNYTEYNNTSEGPTVIIFDKDGSITGDIAPGNYHNIPGLSQILLSDISGTKIVKGIVIFNGLLMDEGTLTEDEFKAAIQHELGHLFNLDHTQVNLDIANACDLGGTCADAQYIPTMFPELKTVRQGTELKIDDKATLSFIYPSSNYQNSFCTIRGEIQDQNGRPLQGVNVIARRVGDGLSLTKEDARSMVSGVLYPACHADGHYYLGGIVPGKTYEVIYEPLTSKYSGMSGFEPLSNPPTGFDSDVIPVAEDGSTTVSCDQGGMTIEMQAVEVPVANPCAAEQITPPTQTGGSTGGCALIQ